jgi:acyl-coenzyme A synthetase/AMP-(fatty) acid ligase
MPSWTGPPTLWGRAGGGRHQPRDRVGVYLQNVPQYPVAMLAIWKLGAVMLCLSPMMKAGELNYR